jgi:hypothetical protein
MDLALSPASSLRRASCRWCSESFGLRPSLIPGLGSLHSAPTVRQDAKALVQKVRRAKPRSGVELRSPAANGAQGRRAVRFSMSAATAM